MSNFRDVPVSKYLSSLGGVLVAWSHYETSINTTIEQIYDNWNGDNVDEDIPRVAISRKIRFLRKWYRENSDFHKIHYWIPNQLEILNANKEIRGIIIHGVMIPDTFTSIEHIKSAYFKTYSPDPNAGDMETVTLTKEDLDTLSRIFMCCALIWQGFTKLLEGGFKHPDDFFAKVDVEFTNLATLLKNFENR